VGRHRQNEGHRVGRGEMELTRLGHRTNCGLAVAQEKIPAWPSSYGSLMALIKGTSTGASQKKGTGRCRPDTRNRHQTPGLDHVAQRAEASCAVFENCEDRSAADPAELRYLRQIFSCCARSPRGMLLKCRPPRVTHFQLPSHTRSSAAWMNLLRIDGHL